MSFQAVHFEFKNQEQMGLVAGLVKKSGFEVRALMPQGQLSLRLILPPVFGHGDNIKSAVYRALVTFPEYWGIRKISEGN
jgi:hypothetical protein